MRPKLNYQPKPIWSYPLLRVEESGGPREAGTTNSNRDPSSNNDRTTIKREKSVKNTHPYWRGHPTRYSREHHQHTLNHQRVWWRQQGSNRVHRGCLWHLREGDAELRQKAKSYPRWPEGQSRCDTQGVVPDPTEHETPMWTIPVHILGVLWLGQEPQQLQNIQG